MAAENWFGRSFLNRASWKRDDTDFLGTAAQSASARFVVLNDGGNPLVKAERDGKVIKDILAEKAEGELILATLGWSDISSAFSASPMFSKEPRELSDPLVVFLGIDERPDSVDLDDKNAAEVARSTQKSLPKASDTSLQPKGQPFFALDTTNHPDLAKKALESHGGEGTAAWIDLRAEILSLDFESTGVVAQARALIDWNKRNKFCPGCGNATASVWGGWKRACLPDQPDRTPERPPCVSKKGVHNFAYPRTDPVVIMGIQSHDGTSLLLGRQKAWPKGFYSCLAGFIEPGESIEESVRREVWEEAGVRVGDVSYHSTQPWPFPGSLMLGLHGTALPDTDIRLDLDNELEHAAFYPLDEVREALAASERTGFSRHDVEQIQKGYENAEDAPKGERKKAVTEGKIRLPPKTAIATQLVKAWVASKDKEQQGKL